MRPLQDKVGLFVLPFKDVWRLAGVTAMLLNRFWELLLCLLLLIDVEVPLSAWCGQRGHARCTGSVWAGAAQLTVSCICSFQPHATHRLCQPLLVPPAPYRAPEIPDMQPVRGWHGARPAEAHATALGRLRGVPRGAAHGAARGVA